MGTWGPGLFDNAEALKWIFGAGKLRPDDLGEFRRPATVVAAAAVAAAGLEPGEDVRAQIVALGHDPAAVLVPEGGPALADAALAALLIATGPDGEWQQGWADAGTGLPAREAVSQLASIFYRYQHRHDQELPLEY